MATLNQESTYRPFQATDITYAPESKQRRALCKHYDSGVQGICYAADSLKHAAAFGLACEQVDEKLQLTRTCGYLAACENPDWNLISVSPAA